MVQIIATREIRYAGKRVLPGERFDASEKDAKIYVAIKRATLPPPEPTPPPRAIRTMSAPPPKPASAASPEAAPAPEPEAEAAPEATAHPQTYSRRDMAAEPLAGQTGQVRPSPSSRQAPPPKT